MLKFWIFVIAEGLRDSSVQQQNTPRFVGSPYG